MSDNGFATAEWLKENSLDFKEIKVKGKIFRVQEITLGEQTKLFEEHKGGGELTNELIEGVLMSRCVTDAKGQPIVPCEEWAFWAGLGCSFIPLRRAVLEVNGLNSDPLEAAVKN